MCIWRVMGRSVWMSTSWILLLIFLILNSMDLLPWGCNLRIFIIWFYLCFLKDNGFTKLAENLDISKPQTGMWSFYYFWFISFDQFFVIIWTANQVPFTLGNLSILICTTLFVKRFMDLIRALPLGGPTTIMEPRTSPPPRLLCQTEILIHVYWNKIFTVDHFIPTLHIGHALGNYKGDATYNQVPILIDGTAHCADLYAPNSGDPQSLTDARSQISTLVSQWITEAQSSQ